MTDKREAILVRLLAIYKTVLGVKRVARNEQVAEDWEFPAILLLDADEEPAPPEPGNTRPATAPKLVTMTPETYLIFGGLPEKVGSELNRFRARVIKAVLTDAEPRKARTGSSESVLSLTALSNLGPNSDMLSGKALGADICETSEKGESIKLC